MVFEAAFDAQAQWEAFRSLASVQAALEAAPDPINGLLVHRRDGGNMGPPSLQRPTALPTTAATPVTTPPVWISRWETLRGGLLLFLVLMAILLVSMAVIVLVVFAPVLGF